MGERWQKANSPPGRSSRATSGTVRRGRRSSSPRGRRTRCRSSLGQRDGLGAGLDQRHLDARLQDQPASMGELTFGEVEADRPGTGPGQVDRPLRGAAAQLEDVAAGDLTEHTQLRLGKAPGAPGLGVAGELPPVSCLVVVGVGVPGSPVPPLVPADTVVRRRDLGGSLADRLGSGAGGCGGSWPTAYAAPDAGDRLSCTQRSETAPRQRSFPSCRRCRCVRACGRLHHRTHPATSSSGCLASRLGSRPDQGPADRVRRRTARPGHGCG